LVVCQYCPLVLQQYQRIILTNNKQY
jgi:hypothetical protein